MREGGTIGIDMRDSRNRHEGGRDSRNRHEGGKDSRNVTEPLWGAG